MTQSSVEQALQLADQHRQAGRLAEAELLYRQIIAIHPNHAQALHFLGAIQCQTGKFEQAVEVIRRAIAIDPQLADAHYNLGIACSSLGRLDDAVAAYSRSIEVQPKYAAAYNNLGNVLAAQRKLDEAVAAFSRAIQLKPDYVEAYVNLGIALQDQHKLDEAIGALSRAIQINPTLAEAHSNLGVVLRAKGALPAAAAAQLKAIELSPNLAEAHSNLGDVRWEQGRIDDAIAAASRALELKPNLAQAHCILANAFKAQGRIDEAIASLGKAVAFKPAAAEIHSNLCLYLHYDPKQDAASILKEHRLWNQRHAKPLKHLIAPHDNDRSPDRRLKIGYVSPDFREHAVGKMILPLLANHNHQHFEIFCYSDTRQADHLTQRAKQYADRWCDVAGVDDARLAENIRADRIDILVDLALHTGGNRLLVFAQKPAPVQVTWLGCPTTTGLDTINYRLTDPYLDPPGENDRDYSEKSVRLPHCVWCFEPQSQTPPVNPLPALKNGFITFGSTNDFAKINPATLVLWVQILQTVANSRLVLKCPPGSSRDRVSPLFRSNNISADRLEFIGTIPADQYFNVYHRIDIGLDTMPYNGHTTTFDYLWMGVAMITLMGRTCVGRGGASILSNLGMPEWIARTPGEYISMVVKLAGDLPGLAAHRSMLRQKMFASLLMDAPGYARDIEAAYRAIWHVWTKSNIN